MDSFWKTSSWVGFFLSGIFSIWILSRRKRSSAATWAWILSFFTLPYLGPLFYLLVGFSSFKRRKRKKPEPQKNLPAQGFILKSHFGGLEPRFSPVSQLAENLSGFPPVPGNKLEFFEGQETLYQALSDAIASAKKYVYLEYYIFKEDPVGVQFRDLLKRKALEGLEVRLLIDHVGSFRLRDAFINPLREAGGKVAFFGSLALKRPWSFQLRNHRKIAVIDGEVAFMGSQNICSDFRQWRIRKLDWIDSQVRIEGSGVIQLETVFREDWNYTTGEKSQIDFKEDYFPYQMGNSVVQILPTGPDEPAQAFEQILMALIHSAQKRITLLTPYFIPTEAVAISLESACRRGVLVDILVPRKSDHWLVDTASKSWHWDLLQGGVRLWETPHSFIHAKQVTVDSEVALLGSANMDERSFRLNFECSSLIFDSSQVVKLVETFDSQIGQAQPISIQDLAHPSFLALVRDGIFRLISPLL